MGCAPTKRAGLRNNVRIRCKSWWLRKAKFLVHAESADDPAWTERPLFLPINKRGSILKALKSLTKLMVNTFAPSTEFTNCMASQSRDWPIDPRSRLFEGTNSPARALLPDPLLSNCEYAEQTSDAEKLSVAEEKSDGQLTINSFNFVSLLFCISFDLHKNIQFTGIAATSIPAV